MGVVAHCKLLRKLSAKEGGGQKLIRCVYTRDCLFAACMINVTVRTQCVSAAP